MLDIISFFVGAIETVSYDSNSGPHYAIEEELVHNALRQGE